MKNKRKAEDEIAATASVQTEEDDFVPEKKGLSKIFGYYKSLKSGINQASTVMDFLNDFRKNKYHVQRRLNIIFLFVSMAFAVISGLNFIFGGTLEKVHFAWAITVYSVFGLYALAVIGIFVAEMLYRRNVTVKTTKTYNKVLTVFKRVVRAISLVMSAVTFAITIMADDMTGKALAMNVIVQIFSVIMFIISLSTGISKLVIKFVMWLKSPVNRRQFRFVATEWYSKVNSDNKNDKAIRAVKKVQESRLEGIQRAIDVYLIKPLGKKYIREIRPSDIASAVEGVPDADRDDVEGTVKQIFEYALERGIIESNPCDSINLSGNIEKKLKKPEDKEQSEGILSKLFGKK